MKDEDKKGRDAVSDDAVINSATGDDYKYGIVSEIDTDIIPRGLNEDVVRLI